MEKKHINGTEPKTVTEVDMIKQPKN